MRVTHHLKLEEDKEVRRYAEGEREQEQDERMAQQEQPLGHERPVDHLVHVPWGLHKKRSVFENDGPLHERFGGICCRLCLHRAVASGCANCTQRAGVRRKTQDKPTTNGDDRVADEGCE